MKREWKPGDVLIDEGERGIVTTATREHTKAEFVEFGNGSTRLVVDLSAARPLVVIDPEDREQVERLISAMDVEWGEVTARTDWPEAVPHMQAALREFANPTPSRPDEPTAIWSVVETDSEDQWVRALGPDFADGWVRAGDLPSNGAWTHYEDIPNVVRILSEGVQP